MKYLILVIKPAFKKSLAKAPLIQFYMVKSVATYFITGLDNIQLQKLVVAQRTFPGAC